MSRKTCAVVIASVMCALLVTAPAAQAAGGRQASALKVNLIVPDPESIGDTLALNVAYRGAAVDSMEFYLDGALAAKRQAEPGQTRGIVSFSLETALLIEGVHNVQVKAYTADGTVRTITAKIKVPGADLSAPVRIAYPQTGVQVSGTVPIRVTLTSDLQSRNPYVTFFVDRELKVLRNYPPYEYIWDTTETTNGWHSLEAWAQSQSDASPFRARVVRVNVNNAGGRTDKQDDIADLRATSAVKPIVLPIEPATRMAAATTNTPDLDPAISGTAVAPSANAQPQIGGEAVRSAEPSGYGYGAASLPRVTTPGVTATRARSASASSPRMMGGAVVQPRSHMMIASKPRGMEPTELLMAGLPPMHSAGADTVKIRPGDTMASVSRKTGVAVKEIARLNSISPKSQLRAGGSLIMPNSGTFDVAFDGTQIAFDVAPRVENGMALAPFRQIFAHTGGTLYWYGTAKKVRAVNSSREIELKIGSNKALVNNRNMKMDHSAYLDSGRTIVPMTFIGQSLDVRVSYDQKSGRLLLRSK